jgi:hypothetical protein
MDGAMTEPARMPPLEYDRLVAESRRSVIWALDGAQGPWELEPGEPPADGADWFFIVNFPRTGSSVARMILNRHPEIFCGNEHLFLPLLMTVLHSKLLLAPELWFSVRYSKKIPVTAANVRELMDAWRRCVSERRIFGDKGEMYYQHFGGACREIFPGCRFVLTVRHPLDALSSYIHQPWAGYMRESGTREAFFEQLRARAREMLTANTVWRDRSEVIEFEELATEEGFQATFTRVFTHLGADPGAYDWPGGWALCRHRQAFGRWERDTDIREFLDWLDARDESLHEVLTAGSRYLDADLQPD